MSRQIFSPLWQQYSAELARPLSLRMGFPPALEAEYLLHKDERSVPLLRLGCVVAVVLYSLFFFMDFLFQRRLTEPWMFFLAFGVASPATLVPAAATLLLRWRKYARQLAAPATVINGAALIIGIAITQQHGKALPYEILVLVLMYMYFLGGILFRVAFPLAAMVAAAYVVADAFTGLPLYDWLDHAFVMLAIVVLGGMSCYLLERAERRSWLRAQLVEEMAIHDELTGLHNRHYFYEHGAAVLAQARREHKPVAVLVADADHFKRYNDALGHLAGDDCLRRIAAVLREAARRPLDLAVRFGGEEFVLILFDIRQDAVLAHAEQLRAAVEQLGIAHPDAPLGHVSLSVGATCATEDKEFTLDQLVAIADRALYQAKAEGRNRVRFAVA